MARVLEVRLPDHGVARARQVLLSGLLEHARFGAEIAVAAAGALGGVRSHHA